MKRTENEDRRKRRAELEMEEYAEIAPFWMTMWLNIHPRWRSIGR